MPDSNKDRPIFIRADRSVPYGEFFGPMEILRAGGYTKVKLVALERAPYAPCAASQSDALSDRCLNSTSTGHHAGCGFLPQSLRSRCMPAGSRWRSCICRRMTRGEISARGGRKSAST